MNIVTTEGQVAFTPTTCPGFTEDNPADESQLTARCDQMNAKAEELGIKTRYEVAS